LRPSSTLAWRHKRGRSVRVREKHRRLHMCRPGAAYCLQIASVGPHWNAASACSAGRSPGSSLRRQANPAFRGPTVISSTLGGGCTNEARGCRGWWPRHGPSGPGDGRQVTNVGPRRDLGVGCSSLTSSPILYHRRGHPRPAAMAGAGETADRLSPGYRSRTTRWRVAVVRLAVRRL
jgi:hypothetical protein